MEKFGVKWSLSTQLTDIEGVKYVGLYLNAINDNTDL